MAISGGSGNGNEPGTGREVGIWCRIMGLCGLILAPVTGLAQSSGETMAPQPASIPALRENGSPVVAGSVREWEGLTSHLAPRAGGTERAVMNATGMQDPPFTMRIGARVQTRFTHANPDDGPTTNTVHIRRARLTLAGAAYQLFDYAIQVELAGGSPQLLDANLRHTFAPYATLWFGQGKAYFGRQLLISSGNLQFVDRTIVDNRFAANRQQGIALTGRLADDHIEYNLGAYNGNGINQAANPNNRFMAVGRLVFSPFDPHPLTEGAPDYAERPRLALGVSGLNNTTGESEAEVGIRRMNAEAAFTLRGLSALSEIYREWADPLLGEELITNGWYGQAGYLLPDRHNELAVRYATIRPGQEAPSGLTEMGVAYSYYFRAHSAKVQTDLRNIRDRVLDADRREIRVQFQLAL